MNDIRKHRWSITGVDRKRSYRLGKGRSWCRWVVMVGAPGWKGWGSGSEDVQVRFYLEFHQTFNFIAWSKSISEREISNTTKAWWRIISRNIIFYYSLIKMPQQWLDKSAWAFIWKLISTINRHLSFSGWLLCILFILFFLFYWIYSGDIGQ